ncbi:PREDICTED: DNA-(apurinic or apyrimidinic site) lyase 2 isoform X2 [Miniopterus natalensis]|uniref:DNA-(apurinic or apyrimidinic site) lyase 2 isoform X1 n=1 Tax=Miniopterus natalensis TaxID=291302 RepID=UPI0007A6E02E|nr:PREDICTED: DNA-(apurinic or apyrimidinic site) lyase 2 isoform X1 [Miniopterus natalensis]XP_016076091.1 PREDICTED: DNA-(apurinic or apyrimidinic site) lyase 2 isoform X2 [Miniopterus natalensis]
MLRLVSWNINGIRSPLQAVVQEPNNCTAKSMARILDKLDADILCLQETKVTRDVLTEPLAIIEGYNSYFSFSRNRSGYSGVATFCKDSATPVAAEEGLSGVLAMQKGDVGCYGNMDEFTQEELRALDNEGRALLTQHKIRTWEGKEKILTLINVYCPHAGKPERLAFKMRFYHLLQIRAEALLAAGSHVIILGDLNTAHRPIDHCDAVNLECFEEDPGRKWMDGLLSNLDCQGGSPVGTFTDSFRCFHPKQEGAFTCWSTVTGARRLNYGSRIDYVLGDRTLVMDTFQDSFLLPEVMGSDHCPVGAVLSVSPVPAKQCPPLCTRFLPEFSGTQLKILHFLVHHKQDRVSKQSAQQLSTQTQVQMRQNKARVRSTRLRPSQAGSNRGQKKLINYFQPSSSCSQAPNLELPSLGTLVTPKTPEDKVMVKVMEGQTKASEAKDEKEVRTSFWKSVLGGPLPMPLCRGHGEPCVMRTVKKPGPNQGRHFYMCSRPRGPSTDPSSRCNFFLWSRPS